MTERNGVIEPDEQRRLSGFNPDFPTDAALDDLVADRYRLMSHMERDELVREMADAISTLRERIATLESMLRVCRSAFEQRGLMTYVWEIDSTTARAALDATDSSLRT